MKKEELVSFIDAYLKPLGFKKKVLSWYKDNPETITIFSIYKSRFGDIYYVTLSVQFRAISLEKRPKFYQSHSQLRAERFGENSEEYLNLEKNTNESVRRQKINQLLDKSVSLLNQMETIAGFKELLKNLNPRFFNLDIATQKYLGINIE